MEAGVQCIHPEGARTARPDLCAYLKCQVYVKTFRAARPGSAGAPPAWTRLDGPPVCAFTPPHAHPGEACCQKDSRQYLTPVVRASAGVAPRDAPARDWCWERAHRHKQEAPCRTTEGQGAEWIEPAEA
ncbi:MAG: hypothetical protein OHK0015_21940 [Chloroflexi bacterium OHK40]